MKFLYFVTFLLLSLGMYSQEICDNGIDDDADGLIDLNDTTDCRCALDSTNVVNVPSLIPNHSFEQRNCCPTGYAGGTICASTWIQASPATSDYWNTCGTATGSPADGGAPMPYPHGNGILGFIAMQNWQEYVGACLLSPMVQGRPYRLDCQVGYSNNSPSMDLVIYGTSDCVNLPFTGNDCPIGQADWTELGRVNMGGLTQVWEPKSITFTPPFDVRAIAIGAPCGLTNSRTYYYLDDLVLNSVNTFASSNIVATGHLCKNNLVLTANRDTNAGTWQWYKDGVALANEIDSFLNVSTNNYGIGEYTARLDLGIECRVTSYTVMGAPDIIFDTVVTNTCSNIANGLIAVDNIMGSTATPFQYQIDNQAFQNDSIFRNLNHGTYSIKVRDSNNCVDSATAIISPYDVPVPAFQTSSNFCLGAVVNMLDQSTIASGSIINWLWSFDSQTSNSQNVNHIFTSTGAQDVKLLVTSDNGCVDSITNQIMIFQSSDLISNFTFDNNVCQFEPLDIMNTTTNRGMPFNSNYTFKWYFGDGDSSINVHPSHIYLVADTFDINLMTQSDAGCTSDTTLQVIVRPKPDAIFSFDSVCLNLPTSLNDASTIPSGEVVEWMWSNDSITQNTTQIFGNDGQHNVTLIINSDYGCADTVTNVITVHPLPIADFEYKNSTVDYFNNIVRIENLSEGAQSYEWLLDNSILSNDINPIQTYNIEQPCADYTSRLVAFTEFGCTDTIVKTIESIGILSSYVPNSFTPDNNGINDVFLPIHRDFDLEKYEFKIFNRWGKVIFETSDVTQAWDGKIDGTDAPQGSYVYTIQVKEVCGNPIPRILSGSVILLR